MNPINYNFSIQFPGCKYILHIFITNKQIQKNHINFNTTLNLKLMKNRNSKSPKPRPQHPPSNNRQSNQPTLSKLSVNAAHYSHPHAHRQQSQPHGQKQKQHKYYQHQHQQWQQYHQQVYYPSKDNVNTNLINNNVNDNLVNIFSQPTLPHYQSPTLAKQSHVQKYKNYSFNEKQPPNISHLHHQQQLKQSQSLSKFNSQQLHQHTQHKLPQYQQQLTLTSGNRIQQRYSQILKQNIKLSQKINHLTKTNLIIENRNRQIIEILIKLIEQLKLRNNGKNNKKQQSKNQEDKQSLIQDISGLLNLNQYNNHHQHDSNHHLTQTYNPTQNQKTNQKYPEPTIIPTQINNTNNNTYNNNNNQQLYQLCFSLQQQNTMLTHIKQQYHLKISKISELEQKVTYLQKIVIENQNTIIKMQQQNNQTINRKIANQNFAQKQQEIQLQNRITKLQQLLTISNTQIKSLTQQMKMRQEQNQYKHNKFHTEVQKLKQKLALQKRTTSKYRRQRDQLAIEMERVIGEMIYGERMGIVCAGVGVGVQRQREREKIRKREGREEKYENIGYGAMSMRGNNAEIGRSLGRGTRKYFPEQIDN